jgi:hypothetical protein
MKPTSYIADFDSAAAMLRALANYLRGRDFPLLGAMPRWRSFDMKGVAHLVNRLPNPVKEQVYIWSGRYEAIKPQKLRKAKTEKIAEWAVSLYPRRQYPAVAVGSSNGALTHLWAALGIPWLPQTFLIPVARVGPNPDEPLEDVKWAEKWADLFLRENPDVQLHHMHDPNQDRLMIQRMTYFRVKRLFLGTAYERFIEESLAPGGTIFIVECGLKWPTTKFGARHIFQFGALGGATPDEYHHGGARVEDYLRRHKSHRNSWEPPPPDGERPEAEWGFEPQLRESIEALGKRRGFQLRRIVFEGPEHVSPLVADFYQWWNRKRFVAGKRLLVESFIVMEPYWAIRTGSVPFWMVFNKLPSAEALEAYLGARDPFDEIYMMLFSHGVESIGLAPIDRWRAILRRARKTASFVGVDENAYPRDFAVFVRYYFELKRKIESRYPIPSPVSLNDFDRFLHECSGRYDVHWSTPEE